LINDGRDVSWEWGKKQARQRTKIKALTRRRKGLARNYAEERRGCSAREPIAGKEDAKEGGPKRAQRSNSTKNEAHRFQGENARKNGLELGLEEVIVMGGEKGGEDVEKGSGGRSQAYSKRQALKCKKGNRKLARGDAPAGRNFLQRKGKGKKSQQRSAAHEGNLF